MTTATAQAFANIAFIKYWGNRDEALRIPASGSISMNLAGLETRTTVSFDPDLLSDRLEINGQPADSAGLSRASRLLERVRHLAGSSLHARVSSSNNFPTGAGIASSASAFAALSLAATKALGLELSERDLSRLARSGSGSACRSIPTGFVEWLPGQSDADSYAVSIAPPEHWDLVDCVAVLSTGHKPVGSTQGHALASTSPLQSARLDGASARLELCRSSVLERDFDALARVIELDSNLMHAVMQTSTPPLLYWQPQTLAVMQAVVEWRRSGLPAAYTIDAGPNVHVITLAAESARVAGLLMQIPGVQRVLSAPVGPGARLDPRS